ncbi:MAG: hypothetical protein GAK31_03237 [Stenotrophomonas maltophilia]|uniref:Transmembrane protein n=1 Tax=Stenotrophomonas maltophilia TaxID=40324 RepID=A0A7V8FF60_STEMA|nr:MAG: hypothetical protein GAK31_03237 [Stenotrophomonas maltophilia]
MDGIVDRLISLQDGRLLFPLILCAAAVLLFKGLATIQQSKGSSRKEFLELFQRDDKKDDLWLSVAIRHQFGTYLPVSIIKRLSALDQPARALLEISDAWSLIDLDEATGEVVWRKRRYASETYRRRMSRFWVVGYFAIALAAVMLGYFLLVSGLSMRQAAVYWLYVAIGLTAAFFCLHRSMLLKEGSEAIERWLGMK